MAGQYLPFTQFPGTSAHDMIILASNSPRRKELLALLGLPFRACPAEIDESVLPGESPRAYVLRLAEGKARAVAAHVPAAGSLVIAADTTVADGSDILGKPEDEQQAVEMLTRLRGHLHQVYTAVAILPRRGQHSAAGCLRYRCAHAGL